MKKLLMCLSVLFFISGCNDSTDSLTCTMRSTANGLTTDTEYKIDYNNDDVKFVTITYDYTNDNNTTTNGTNTTGTNTTGANQTTNETDGVNADTDGLTTNDDKDNNTGNNNSNEVIDGAVGDAIDGAVEGVTDTILDLAGIRNTYENQMSSYDNIEGFTYNIDTDDDNEYKVVYKIDFDKISDSDLTRFNIDRSLKTTRSNYEDLGYTCK